MQTVFVTTTCLDFVHVFAEPKLADLMAACIAETCRRTDSLLHAFVVMPHHVHLLATPPEGTAVTALVRSIKSNSARRIRPLLSAYRESGFDQQRALNRHVFWQRSFRSYVVRSPKQFDQKLVYIHDNPCRAGLTDTAGSYPWSSLRFYTEGHGSYLHELDIAAVLGEFAPGGLPPVSASHKPQ